METQNTRSLKWLSWKFSWRCPFFCQYILSYSDIVSANSSSISADSLSCQYQFLFLIFCQKQSISCNLRLALLSGPSNPTPLDQMTKRCLRPLPSGSKIATVHIFANFTKSLPAIKTKGIKCNQMELYKKNAKTCNLNVSPKSSCLR